jgi:glycosyltransferase involved in cell wall biosynthesis
LQPSRKAKHGWIEGFGVSITEAMASALPVIASNTGGIPDQVRDGLDGFLVEIDSYKDIAECILKYEADEELRKRHGNSARTQAQCFDAKVLGHKFEDIILQNLV